MVRRWNPAGVSTPLGAYSHAASAPAGSEIVFVAGQLGVGVDGVLVGPDAESQTRQVLANIGSVLAGAGGDPRHLTRLFAMVAGTDHLAGYRTALREWLGTWFPANDFPPQSLVVVVALAAPEFVVEVEACAAIPRGDRT